MPATFAFIRFAFSFSFTLWLAFAFGVKSVATARGGFSRHVTILIQEVLLKRGESAKVESSIGTPGCNVGVELRPGLNRRDEVVNSCELGDIVSAIGEEFVFLSHRTAEIAEVCEQNKWGHDSGLSSVDFVFIDCAKHSLKFTYEVEGG